MLEALLVILAAYATCRAVLNRLLAGEHGLLLDYPNTRSLHTHPVPRVGGLGIGAGTLAGLIVAWPQGLGALILPTIGLMALSLVDDSRGLPVAVRLAGHVAGVVLFLGLSESSTSVATLVVLLGLVWMTNLYNFMDGADGLAGGMAVFGFGGYALLAGLAGDSPLALLAVAVTSAAMGFLALNFPPARLFMGDAGSIGLGFLAGALGYIGAMRGTWSWALPLLAFSPFIVDASITLIRRGLRRERVWLAHRDHYYQRLVRMGWGHRRLMAAEYTLMFATTTCGVIVTLCPTLQWPALTFWAVFYGLVLKWIDRRWREFEHGV